MTVGGARRLRGDCKPRAPSDRPRRGRTVHTRVLRTRLAAGASEGGSGTFRF